MRRVRLVGGDGVLGHVLGRHMHMEGHVPDEDCQGSRWPGVQCARSGKGSVCVAKENRLRGGKIEIAEFTQSWL